MGKESIHKEFLQEMVTVENILQEYHTMNREKFFNDSKLLHEYLQHGSSKMVAQLIEK